MRPYRGSRRTYKTPKGLLEDQRDPIGPLGGLTGPYRGSWRTYGTLKGSWRTYRTLKGLLEDL